MSSAMKHIASVVCKELIHSLDVDEYQSCLKDATRLSFPILSAEWQFQYTKSTN